MAMKGSLVPLRSIRQIVVEYSSTVQYLLIISKTVIVPYFHSFLYIKYTLQLHQWLSRPQRPCWPAKLKPSLIADKHGHKLLNRGQAT